jgi:cytochrome b involved in lipid metabolism
MKSYATQVIIGLIVVVAIGTLVYSTKKPYIVPVESVDLPATTTAPTQPSVTMPVTPTGITLTQVAERNSRTSCWSVINGNVYDLTSWIPNHPGGEKSILSLCGVDGSASYNRKHGGDTRPPKILAGFKLGALAQ